MNRFINKERDLRDFEDKNKFWGIAGTGYEHFNETPNA